MKAVGLAHNPSPPDDEPALTIPFPDQQASDAAIAEAARRIEAINAERAS